MEIYKQATKQKLRISTSKGSLSVEQLWDLSLLELDEIAVRLEEDKNKTSKSFLEDVSAKDKESSLKFDLVLDVLKTKKMWQERAQKAQETKEKKQRILEILHSKKDEELRDKDPEELEKMLEEL